MTRGGVLLAVVLTLALAPAAAAGQTAPQPDLMIEGRADLVGANLYNSDGVGQQRNLIVEKRLELLVLVENDGAGRDAVSLHGSPRMSGFRVRYQLDIEGDVTRSVVGGSLSLRFGPGARTHFLRVTIRAEPNAPLGAVQELLITATSKSDPNAIDAIKATITKTSTPD